MQFSNFLTFVSLSAVAYATVFHIDTSTAYSKTTATITSCEEEHCTHSPSSAPAPPSNVPETHLLTFTTFNLKTVVVTDCDTHPCSAPSAVPSSESDSYVDLTSTPVATVSTGVVSTQFKQSSSTSYYNSSSSHSVPGFLENNAPKSAVLGVAGLAGMIAFLL